MFSLDSWIPVIKATTFQWRTLINQLWLAIIMGLFSLSGLVPQAAKTHHWPSIHEGSVMLHGDGQENDQEHKVCCVFVRTGYAKMQKKGKRTGKFLANQKISFAASIKDIPPRATLYIPFSPVPQIAETIVLLLK